MNRLEDIAEFQKESFLTLLENCEEDLAQAVSEAIKNSFLAGAGYVINNAWQRGDGDYLPEIDREVIALQRWSSGHRVVYAHRPNPNGYVVVDGERLYPKCYDKGGWNMEGIEYWLDVKMPNDGKEETE
jgi:hypothetical protein